MKSVLLLLFLASIFTSSISLAQNFEQAISECAIVEGELERLNCYDQIAQDNNLDGPQAVPVSIEGTGKWIVDVETNPLDDSTTVTLILVADEGQSSLLRQPIGLVARCSSFETNFYINWRDFLGSEANVTHRIGGNDAVTSRWSLSTNSQASFYPQAQRMLQELLGEDRFVAQVTPYNENPKTAIFDIRGLENAIVPLRETCGW